MGWILIGALIGGAALSTVWSCGGGCAVLVGLAGAVPGALVGGLVAVLTGTLFRAERATSIRCPACGNRGEFGDEVNFEVRGRLDDRAVQKCLNCGSGLFVEAPRGRTGVIRHDLWMQMQERWVEEFGEGSNNDALPPIARAVESLFDGGLAGIPTSVSVLASAAHDMTGVALQSVARSRPAWAALDLERTTAVIRCGAVYFLLIVARDDALRRDFAVWLDVRPSDVEDAIIGYYNEAFLSSPESQLALDVRQKWDDEDASGHALALTNLIWYAAGRGGTPPIDEVVEWRAALHYTLEPFMEHLASKLEQFARE